MVCLYETSGYSAADFAVGGFEVWNYDISTLEPRQERRGNGWMMWMPWDARDEEQNRKLVEWHRGQTVLVLAFPPCNDLAASGSSRFYEKQMRDPDYRYKAMKLVWTARDLAVALDVPWVIENPVSVISSEWRKPDYVWHPYEYGGYLAEDDYHPFWPEYISPRDAYYKKTCYWVGNGFSMPRKQPVPVRDRYGAQYSQLGGKSERTKQIRSASPRGIARGIYLANSAKT